MGAEKVLKLSQGLAFAALVSVLAVPAGIAQAQDGYGQGNGGEPGNPEDHLNGAKNNPYGIRPGLVATPQATKPIRDAIADSYRFCSSIEDRAYLVDCLGERLDVIAQSLPRSGDYAEARKILADASNKLRRLASQNASPAKPRIRAQGSYKGKRIRTKPLTPVRRDKVKQVNRQAADILAETETKLLRAAAASDRRLIAYAQMAKAIGSNKTLLRSA